MGARAPAPLLLMTPDAQAALERIYHEYLRHQRGLLHLWTWLDRWSKVRGWSWAGSTGVVHPDQRLTDSSAAFLLGESASGRFFLGAPKPHPGVRGTNLFLGVQEEEMPWLERLTWRQAVWDAALGVLWLVSRGIKSPDTDWPDLPSVAVGITITPPEKLAVWTDIPSARWNRPRLDLRTVTWSDTGRVQIARTPLGDGWGVARGALVDNWPAADRQLTDTLNEVTVRRLQSTSVAVNPGFQGNIPDVPEELRAGLRDIIGSFNRSAYKSMGDVDLEQVLRANPEILWQFLDPGQASQQPPPSDPNSRSRA